MLDKVLIVLAIRRHEYMRLADDGAIHTAVGDCRKQCRLSLIPMLACGGRAIAWCYELMTKHGDRTRRTLYRSVMRMRVVHLKILKNDQVAALWQILEHFVELHGVPSRYM